MTDTPAAAWFEALNVIARLTGQTPLPKEVLTVENDDWKLTLNNSKAAHLLQHGALGPFEIFVEGKKYLVFGVLAPFGGMLGGIAEDQFIAEMQAISPETVQ